MEQLIAAVSLEYNSEHDTWIVDIMENFVITWKSRQGIMIKRAKGSTELDQVYLSALAFSYTADFRDHKEHLILFW